jgi:hypothetical protein
MVDHATFIYESAKFQFGLMEEDKPMVIDAIAEGLRVERVLCAQIIEKEINPQHHTACEHCLLLKKVAGLIRASL